jgi:quercetin dioxygenase-like cupin family protein
MANAMRMQGKGMLIGFGFATTSDPTSHSGEVFVLCPDCELEYHIGNQSFLLKPGDSLIFKASQSHSWQNNGEIPATVLLVFESDHTQPVPHRQNTESQFLKEYFKHKSS